MSSTLAAAPVPHAHDDHAAPSHGAHPGSPGGLSVSVAGHTLVPETTVLPRGVRTEFRFVVTGPDGAPVHAYRPMHEKELHLILVRRDGTGFQHVHPVRDDDGTWSVPLTVPDAGSYRVLADTTPVPAAGADQVGGITLGVDVSVAGDYDPRPLPTPSAVSEVDGYTVTLAGGLVAGHASPLTLTIARDGRPVTDLQPYLAAYGHLVALRMGDLAYLHVHPGGAPGDGVTRPGPEIRFDAVAPTPGLYRVFLDFRHDDAVHTADWALRAL